jgi:ubiquitin carboxyl-terminal hydrolase L3
MVKQFIPLESNPEVFNSLIHALGVSNTLGFSDVWSIEPDLLAMVPRQVYARLLVFPVSDTYEAYRHENDSKKAQDYYTTISGSDQEDAIWFKQTIGNACGTYSLLHALANGIPDDLIEPDSPIDKLLSETRNLNVQQRIEYLETSSELEQQHSVVASKGDTEAPSADEVVEYHYVCLTKSKKNAKFCELDGRRTGPIELGESKEYEDLLSEIPLAKVKEFLTRESANVGFSIIALAPNVE